MSFVGNRSRDHRNWNTNYSTRQTIPHDRTLYFSYNGLPLPDAAIKKFVRRFGQIEYYRSYAKVSHCYGFVRYQTVAEATKALKANNFFVNGTRISVRIAFPRATPSLPISTGEAAILESPDDCLLEIFSYLPLTDLLNTSRVNKRFKVLAKRIFATRHRHINTNDLKKNDHKLKALSFDRFLKDFGDSLISMDLDGDHFIRNEISHVFDLIAQNCTNLVSLKLNDVLLNSVRRQYLIQVFGRLEALTIAYGDCDCDFILKNAKALKSLEIRASHSFEDNKAWRSVEMPKMESFLLDYGGDLSHENLMNFLKVNPQLKSFQIIGSDFVSGQIISQIAQFVPKIEKIVLRGGSCTSIPSDKLCQLTSLSSLTLGCRRLNPSVALKEMADANIPLVELHLVKATICDGVIDAISRFDKMKILDLKAYLGFRSEHFKKLGRALKNLEELTAYEIDFEILRQFHEFLLEAKNTSRVYLKPTSNMQITTEMYQKWLNMVQLRENKKPLEIHFNGQHSTLSIRKNLLKNNKNVLDIKMMPFKLDLSESYGDDSDSDFDPDDDDDYDDMLEDDDDYFDFSSDSDNELEHIAIIAGFVREHGHHHGFGFEFDFGF